MSNKAITVNSISKKFRIGGSQPSYKMLSSSIGQLLSRSSLERLGKSLTNKREYFWALDDVSFDVAHGEVIGIIGHNGAGKSTLLKILSRITEPTSGHADVYGRIGSLLEVGTGFHMELTGRENIYLSGAIMGMKKNDIDRRFDEIVDFAGVDKFVDTPVKHYSSGMHLRLAFAVAAHLEPEILLIDEVLAVGDMEFQRKCLNKMENVASEGRTVLFVSHNMGAIKELCQKAMVLRGGRVDHFGPVVQAIRHYSQNVLNVDSTESDAANRSGFSRLAINRGSDCRIGNQDPFEISADLCIDRNIQQMVIHCIMEDAEGSQVVHSYLRTKDIGKAELSPGVYRINAEMPPIYLKPGVYTLFLKMIGEAVNIHQVKYVSERVVIDITDSSGMFAGKVYAAVLPPIAWSFTEGGSVSAANEALPEEALLLK